jgi:hypothetical protein
MMSRCEVSDGQLFDSIKLAIVHLHRYNTGNSVHLNTALRAIGEMFSTALWAVIYEIDRTKITNSLTEFVANREIEAMLLGYKNRKIITSGTFGVEFKMYTDTLDGRLDLAVILKTHEGTRYPINKTSFKKMYQDMPMVMPVVKESLYKSTKRELGLL